VDVSAGSEVVEAGPGEFDTLLSEIGGEVVLAGLCGNGRGHHVGRSVDGWTSRRLADVAALGAVSKSEASVNPASNS